MLDKIKSYWDYGNNFCCLEITSDSNKNLVHLVTAKKKSNEFTNFNFIEATSFSELINSVTKNQHCFLIINNDKVLIKETPFFEKDQKVLSEAFPSLSLSDFYFEILRTKTKSFVAICRKEDVNQLLKEASTQNLEVLGFSLGFSTLSRTIPLINTDHIHTFRHQFTLLDNEIDSFGINHTSINNTSYKIDDFEVSSKFLLALSGIFNYLPTTLTESSNTIPKNHSLRSLQNQKVFFRKGLVVGTSIILFSLLINFLLFNSYYKNLQSKKEEIQLLTSQKEQYLSKSTMIENKEKLVNNILNSSSSKSSFYINRIVAYKPISILFSEIVYQPLQRVIKLEKKVEYESGEIIISGESIDKNTFSNWIAALENFDWVKSVTVTNYGYSKKNESIFSIKISLQDGSQK